MPRRDFHEARVKLFLAAMDEEGGIAEVQEESVPIRIPLEEFEQAQAANFNYSMKLIMRPGGHRIAVGIRDEIGAETSFSPSDRSSRADLNGRGDERVH